MQSYGHFQLVPTKSMISSRDACGAYTKFAAEMAMLAITVAKNTHQLPPNGTPIPQQPHPHPMRSRARV